MAITKKQASNKICEIEIKATNLLCDAKLNKANTKNLQTIIDMLDALKLDLLK